MISATTIALTADLKAVAVMLLLRPPTQPLKLFRNTPATHLPSFVERNAAANPFAIVNKESGTEGFVRPALADLNGPWTRSTELLARCS